MVDSRVGQRKYKMTLECLWCHKVRRIRTQSSKRPKPEQFFFFLRVHPWHMEVPRLGAEVELSLMAYTTATATRDLSCICDLQHSSRQGQVLNPLSEARDPNCNFMVPSWICFCHDRNSTYTHFKCHHQSSHHGSVVNTPD